MITCSVCGGRKFADRPILWDALVLQWQLAPHERTHVDRQQGTHCTACGANLRSIVLANAIRDAVNTSATLQDFVTSAAARRLTILEVNEAGSLSPILRQMPGHVLATYPQVDMHAMPYADETFDLVVHSDTLEHVPNPVHALAECRRVLRHNGTLCFTVPTIPGRMTRSRTGLPNSYHGFAETPSDDLVVHTEYGADSWIHLVQAGFSTVSISTVDFPCACALSARKS